MDSRGGGRGVMSVSASRSGGWANNVRVYGEWRGTRRGGGLLPPKRDSYSLKLVVSQVKPCSRDCAQNDVREESLKARYNFPKGNCDILFKQCDMPIQARYVRKGTWTIPHPLLRELPLHKVALWTGRLRGNSNLEIFSAVPTWR